MRVVDALRRGIARQFHRPAFAALKPGYALGGSRIRLSRPANGVALASNRVLGPSKSPGLATEIPLDLSSKAGKSLLEYLNFNSELGRSRTEAAYKGVEARFGRLDLPSRFPRSVLAVECADTPASNSSFSSAHAPANLATLATRSHNAFTTICCVRGSAPGNSFLIRSSAGLQFL